MALLKNVKPELALRMGFGLMYCYSGYDLFMSPEHWYGFAPRWFSDLIGHFVVFGTYLQIQGIGELAIAFVMLAWFLPRVFVRIGSLLNVTEMALILLLAGLDTITFRDIGLLGGGVALLAIVWTEQQAVA